MEKPHFLRLLAAQQRQSNRELFTNLPKSRDENWRRAHFHDSLTQNSRSKMDIVTDLNNQGIECLKEERIFDGLENFAQALVLCEQLLSSAEQEEQKKKRDCFVLSHTKVTPWILTPATKTKKG
jgi:hypothetical protein